MGSISVKEVKSEFPLMSENQLAALVGKTNYTDSDVIPISRFASSANVGLIKFAAKNDEKIYEIVSPSTAETISGGANPKVRKIQNLFTGSNYAQNETPQKGSIFTNYKRT